MGNQTLRFWRSAAQFFFGSIALALATLACFRLEVGLATTAFIYLIVIVLLSLTGGFLVSAILCIVAAGALRYFFCSAAFQFPVRLPIGRRAGDCLLADLVD